MISRKVPISFSIISIFMMVDIEGEVNSYVVADADADATVQQI